MIYRLDPESPLFEFYSKGLLTLEEAFRLIYERLSEEGRYKLALWVKERV